MAKELLNTIPKDLKTVGDCSFVLISEVSSKSQRYTRTVRAMEVKGVGCVLQTTIQFKNSVSVTSCFLPNCRIEKYFIDKVAYRKIVKV